MSDLKLYGMRASFYEVSCKGLALRDEIYPLIASQIRAERTHRQARSISYRIGGAKFPVLKDLDSFVFADTPVDEGEVRELATGTFSRSGQPARTGEGRWPKWAPCRETAALRPHRHRRLAPGLR